MKVKTAIKAKFKINKLWESPPLHILLTREDDVIVARCLDLTVASHGNDEREAMPKPMELRKVKRIQKKYGIIRVGDLRVLQHPSFTAIEIPGLIASRQFSLVPYAVSLFE